MYLSNVMPHGLRADTPSPSSEVALVALNTLPAELVPVGKGTTAVPVAVGKETPFAGLGAAPYPP